MDKTPLLSVVIPAYNCEDLLDETVGSVLGQLPDDCELIIVDDGSSDGTAEGLRALEGTHRNLRVCYAKHSGVSGARNRGLDLARGEYVTFMDCDDCYRDGFLGKSLPLTRSGADLYIFGIERIPLRGTTEYWTVEDGVYETAGAFADRYVRCRQLLIYSNCNKFYRREVIRRGQVHFDEGSAFGEDRLFNYAFLRACKDREGDRPCVITSSLIMLRYIQRSDQTASLRHVPGYFERVMRLHEEKMSCFLALSEGTTEEERLDFEACDLAREVEKTIDRFARHPEERDENLPLINQLVFGGPYDMEAPVDILVILGSSNCGYRVECALQISKGDPEMTYVVSGGNPYKGGSRTEAEYMAEHLRMRGVEKKQIHLENKARFTRQNLLFSSRIVQGLKREAKGEGSTTLRIGIITGGFHIRRTMLLEEEVGAFAGESVEFFPAYSPMTQQDNWIDDPEGRELVLTELRKTLMVERAGKGCRKEISATSRG